jgi:class 3 adenylate cyclase
MVLLLLILAAILSMPGKISARPQLPDTITSLWVSYNKSGDDSTRIVYLSRLAFFYNDYLEDKWKADSLADAAIRVAGLSNRTSLLILAYNNYLESTDNDLFYQKSVGYANKALQYCRMTGNMPMKWRTCRNLTRVYLTRYQFKNALSVSDEARKTAKMLNNNIMIAESYLCIGSSQESKNQDVEDFRYYYFATNLAEQIMDPSLLRKCYSKLSTYYRDKMLYDEAIEFKNKERKVILSVHPVDSMALMWSQCELQLIEVRHRNRSFNEQLIRKIIDFAIFKRNDRLKNWAFAIYRTHLLNMDEVTKLYNFYTKVYPDEFGKLYKEDIEMYYRLKAYFTELEKNPDSAEFYFKKAEKIVIGTPGKRKLYQSNFYNRYGEFLMRHGRNNEAIEKFKLSFNLSEADGFFGKYEFMLVSSRHMETLYKAAGDYKNAWFCASENNRIRDSISVVSKKEQLMAAAVHQEKMQKDVNAEKDRHKIRQGKNQLNMMAGGVVFFIIVTLLVYRNFRNQKRLNKLLDAAKKKSDDLLLNILPQETAEELKATGRAKAKRFEEVTVLFTDFKNFTLASEQMSPEKLVEEINFYFSEFDSIISRHNIERIKIIGDSYMCAGGLPVVNTTHALDVVSAAVEFQEFVMHQKKERAAREEPFFELRIGVHTGPVVAGIVGHKKFAYDIWGDTVNTASRMESSGEINRVNISGATHEKIKDRFTCTYRGKVTAKNKGEIDMYFVDALLAK